MNRHKISPIFQKQAVMFQLLIIVIFGFSFIPAEEDQRPFSERLVQHFKIQDGMTAEKLYLHLDRPYYTAGDSIWFKGYLVNAGLLTDVSLSNFIYVELTDQFDSLLVRRKFRRDSVDGFKGGFALPAKLQSGNYCFRAYTNWMRNNDPEYFYMRNLYVWNPNDKEIISDIYYEQGNDNEVKARIRFTQKGGKPFHNMEISCLINNKEGDPVLQKNLKTDEKGVVEISFKKDNNWRKKVKPSIDVMFKDYLYNYEQSFPIPEFTPDYAVTFFPEGGKFLAGVQQKMGFLAQNENGFGESVRGWIFNSRGDSLSTFQTEHNGMGSFLITGNTGEQYKVKTRSETGLEKEFLLPAPDESGFTLSISQDSNQILYRILAAPKTIWPDTMYIVAHTRERLHYAYPVTSESAFAVLPDSIFSPGITHFILSNKQGIPVSERLVFVRDHHPVAGRLYTDKPVYEKRKAVNMKVVLNNEENEPMTGSFSVSITNKNKITPDSTGDNIISNLLLTSDLKGYVENPGYYFMQSDSLRNRHLDLVMMTHGWSRFKTDSLLNETTPSIRFPLEKGQFLTGKVRTYLNRKAKSAFVSALSTKDSLVESAQSDANGNYLIETLNYTDSTWFMMVATNKKQKNLVEILPDEETIPKAANKNRFKKPALPKLYQDDSYAQFTNYENNPSVFLKGVTVVASDENIRKKADLRDFEEIQPAFTVNIEGENLRRPKNKNALDAILSIPNTRINNTPESYYSPSAIFYMNTKSRVFVNTTAMDIDVEQSLKLIPGNKIAYVDIYRVKLTATFKDEISFIHKQPDQYLGITDTENYYYLIMITLDSEYQFQKYDHYWMAQAFSLGYTLPKERYHPVYETPTAENQKPDIRHTIYWNPTLPIDRNGKAIIRFYTSDQPENMHVVIEGITDRGKIVRYESDLTKQTK